MKELHLVLFKSRNKDNKHLGKEYKQRSYQFLTTLDKDDPKLIQEFNNFVDKGMTLEVSRFYYSVNSRSEKKTKQALLHYLIDNDVDLSKIDNLTARLSSKPENRSSSKWLFDCDFKDENVLNELIENIKTLSSEEDIVEIVKPTPSGYHIVVKHGFDTRKLFAKAEELDLDVTLKKDEFLFMKMKTK